MSIIILSSRISEISLQLSKRAEELRRRLDQFMRDIIVRKPKLLLLAILSSKAIFVVDGSFFSSKSTLISVVWFMVKEIIIIAQGNFISSIYELYRYSHAAELCRVLLFISIIDLLLLMYLYPSTAIEIEVESDYFLVLHNLWSNKIIFLTV